LADSRCRASSSEMVDLNGRKGFSGSQDLRILGSQDLRIWVFGNAAAIRPNPEILKS
jgi:hypothetical protein